MCRTRGHCCTTVVQFYWPESGFFVYLLSASSVFFLMSVRSDLDRWIEQLRNCEPLAEADVKTLCERAQDLLVEEGNVQYIHSPVTICPRELLPTRPREHLFCRR